MSETTVSEAQALLSVQGLSAGYQAGADVLHDVSFSTGAGERAALMGRNGMGKTTLLRALMGQVQVSAGVIAFAEHDIRDRQPYLISNLGVGYVPQGREIFKDFTVEENLRLGTLGKAAVARTIPPYLFERFPILSERRKQQAGTLSGGEQQQLAIARALIGRPRLLLLDEPSEGIQPSIVHDIGVSLAAIAREQSIALLLVEQSLELVLALTTRVLFIENGRIVAESPTQALRDDPALLERYLSV